MIGVMCSDRMGTDFDGYAYAITLRLDNLLRFVIMASLGVF